MLIRRSGWTLALAGVEALGALLALIWVAVLPGLGERAVSAVLLVALGWLAIRAARAGLIFGADSVTVRGWIRTRRIPASDVRGFSVEPFAAAGGLRWCVGVKLRDDQAVRVLATASYGRAVPGRLADLARASFNAQFGGRTDRSQTD